jgi:hypothetical protein
MGDSIISVLSVETIPHLRMFFEPFVDFGITTLEDSVQRRVLPEIKRNNLIARRCRLLFFLEVNHPSEDEDSIDCQQNSKTDWNNEESITSREPGQKGEEETHGNSSQCQEDSLAVMLSFLLLVFVGEVSNRLMAKIGTYVPLERLADIQQEHHREKEDCACQEEHGSPMTDCFEQQTVIDTLLGGE